MYLAHPHPVRFLSLLLFVLLLCACEGGVSQEVRHAPRQPTSEDRCPVCGMQVLGWPGPKGQLFVSSTEQPLFFDNTVDLMHYALHPDRQSRVLEIYVQDMSQADWDQPDVAPWIDARTAWFVVGHSRMGSMGPTLASFAQRTAAEAFAAAYQGEVLGYGDIDGALLDRLAGAAGDGQAAGHHGHAH